LGHLFPKPLPEKLGAARFFYFTSDWEPRAVAPPRRVWNWFGTDVPALRALLGMKQGTLREADFVYPGPQTDDDFAGLIGASGQVIRWPRCAAFLIASVVAQLPYLFQDPLWFWITALPQAALFGVAAIAAFRNLPSALAPAAAAVVPAVYASVGPGHGSLLRTFAVSLGFLAGLAWATRRIRPLALALWMGAMCGWLTGELIQYWTSEGLNWFGSEAFWLSLLRPILFAACLTAAIRFMPAKWEQASPKSDGRNAG
jgi:hypothetical protein